MEAAFWRLAFRVYAQRKPSKGFELFAVWGVGAMAFLYAVAVMLNPTFANGLRLVIALMIVIIGLAHRRVRLERNKGPDALYAKALAASR